MALTEEQIKRVQRMFHDEWESREELRQFFETISDPEELHLYARNFNWDTGIRELREVIRHPLCDRGTALLIYWRGGPGFYARFADRSETLNPDMTDVYDLLQEIEQKIMSGHYRTQRFPYNPRDDGGHDMTARHTKHVRKRLIPPEMLG